MRLLAAACRSLRAGNAVYRLYVFLLFLGGWAGSAAAVPVPPGFVPQAVEPVKYALVVGVEHYDHFVKVENAWNDGLIVSQAFDAAGYSFVRFLADPGTADSIVDALKELTQRAAASSRPVVLTFFYAGHGFQSGGINWIVPAGAGPYPLQDSLPLTTVVSYLSRPPSGLGIILLDACRSVRRFDGNALPNLPLGVERASGFASMNDDQISVVQTAASANHAASSVGVENPGDSPYTEGLHRYIPKNALSLVQVFEAVGTYVKGDTIRKQSPEETKLDGTVNVFLRPTMKSNRHEDAVWNYVMSSGPRLRCLEDYLSSFPAGRYSRAAEYLKSLISIDTGGNKSCELIDVDPDPTS